MKITAAYIIKSLRKITKSNWFFYLILAIFIFQTLWVAISNRYPGALDEVYHFRLIEFYSHQFSPFISNQPDGLSILGSVTRSPSYLYHYLMSFPFRVIRGFSSSIEFQIISLRIINITLMSTAIIVFRKAILLLGTTKTIAHISLFIFTMLPIVILLASNINYDNLLILLSALSFLYLYKIIQNEKMTIDNILKYIFIGLLASLVKFVFIPIFLAGILYIIYLLFKMDKSTINTLKSEIVPSIKQGKNALLIIGVLVLSMLVFERHVYNLVKYKTPDPDCQQILSVENCEKSGVWARNKNNAKKNEGIVRVPAQQYLSTWTDSMTITLVYVVGRTGDAVMPITYLGVWFFITSGLAATLYVLKTYLSNKAVISAIVLSGMYVIVLFIQNYNNYLYSGEPTGIQGRYILPVLPLIITIFLMSYKKILLNKPKTTLFVVLIAGFIITQGGGATTYILRSQKSWYWNNNTIIDINNSIKKILDPIIKG